MRKVQTSNLSRNENEKRKTLHQSHLFSEFSQSSIYYKKNLECEILEHEVNRMICV